MSILYSDSIRYSLRPSRNSHVKLGSDPNVSQNNFHLKRDGDVEPHTVVSSDDDGNSNGFYEDESDGMNLSPSNDTQEQVELRSSAPRVLTNKFQAADSSQVIQKTQPLSGNQNYLQNKENISTFANQHQSINNIQNQIEWEAGSKNVKGLTKGSIDLKKKSSCLVRNSVKGSLVSDQQGPNKHNKAATTGNKLKMRPERSSNNSISNASYNRESQHSIISNGEDRPSHKRNFDTAYNELAYKLYQQQMNESFSRQKKGLNAFDLLLSPKQIKELEEKRIFDKNYQKELGKRLMGESVAIQEHNQRLASAYMAEKMRECTFVPKIHSNEGERRTFDEFLEGQDNYQRNLEEKKRRLKEQFDTDFKEETTLKPEIDRNSRRLVELKQQTSPRATLQVFERLYQASLMKSGTGQNQNNSKVNESLCSNFFPTKELNKDKNNAATSGSTEEQNSFRPSIQERSKKLVRTDPIDKHLYNDALRRAKKQKQLERKAPNGNAKVLSKSAIKKNNRIVAKKFIRQYDAVVGNFGIYADQKIDYITVSEILNNMGFIKNKGEGLDAEERALLFELWWILKGEKYSGVLRQNLCLFLLAIMNIPYKFPKAVPGGLSALALTKDEDSKLTPNKVFTQYQTHQNMGDSLQDASSDSFYQPNGSMINDNYNQSKEFFDKLNTARMNQNGSRKIGMFDENGFWSIASIETEEIHIIFQLFYRNMLSNEELGGVKKAEIPIFKPEILETSKALALNYREKLLEETAVLIENETIRVKIPDNGRITHADLLVIQQKAQKAMIEKRKDMIDYQELKECTFHPQINDYFQGDIQSKPYQEEAAALNKNSKMPASSLGKNRTLELYKLARPAGMKKDKNPFDLEYEKNCDECTFQPDTAQSKSNANIGKREYFAKNIDKTIERMRLGNKEREYVNKWKDRSFPGKRDFQPFSINLGDIYNKQEENQESGSQNDYQDNGIQHQETNNFYNYREYDSPHEEYEEYQAQQNEPGQPQELNLIRNKAAAERDKVPLLFVDVNLGPNRSERIIVFEGDKSDELADRFSLQHGLDSTMRLRLKELLDSQISGLLCRIEEEMPSVNSDNESYKQN